MKRFILPGRARKLVMLAAAAGAAVFVLTACATLTGGGWMASAVSGKATFGFNLTCDDNGFLVGDWTYHDKAAGVDIAGSLTADDDLECNTGDAGGTASWELPFAQQHCSVNCSGTADITVTDTNNGGKLKGDELSIGLEGDGSVDGYSNDGTIAGGNLTVTGATQG